MLPEEPEKPRPAPPAKARPKQPPRATFPSESAPPARAAPIRKPPPTREPAPVTATAAPEPAQPAPSTASSPPPRPPPAKPPASKDEDDTDGIFGPFRIGGLVGVGLPGVLSFGGAIKLTRYFGAGLNISVIPTIRISLYGEAELAYKEYDIYGRIFPFGGMFFVGAGAGYATITGSLRSSYDVRAYQHLAPGLPPELFVESEAFVRTLVLMPQIGLQHTFGSGLTLGIDAGAQVPIAPSEIKFETRLPAGIPQQVIDQYVEPNNQKVRDTLDTIGRAIVPTLNLRVGWLL